MATPDTSETLHFKDYWRIIRSHIGIILILFIICVGTGFVVTEYFLPKQYGGTAQIRILKDEQKVKVFDPSNTAYYDPVFFESEKETMESKQILYPVIERLDMVKTWSQRYLHGEGNLREDEVYLLLLKKHLHIDPKRGSNIVEVTAITEDPQEAPKIANEIAREYISARTSYEDKNTQAGLQTVADQVKQQEETFRKANQKVEDLRRELGVTVIGGSTGSQNEMQLADQELQRKQQMLDEQHNDTEARRVRLDSLKTLSDLQLIDALPALGLDDQNVRELRQQQLQAQANLESLLNSGLGPDHPRVQALQASLNKLDQQVKDIAAAKRTALQIDLQVSQQKLTDIQKDVDTLRDKVRVDRSEKMAPYQDAIKDAETQKLILDQLNIRYKQESVDKKVTGDPAIIISEAEPDIHPVKPILALNLALAGIAGLMLGLGIAFFIEHLDTSIKTLPEIEKHLGVPVLTVVPRGVKPLNKVPPDSPYAESYRILRARIDLQAGNNQGNAITVLSGGPGEGKSTTLFNLGFVCAQSGQTVVIVDADLRRPSLHRILGLELAPGLSDYLERGGAISDYLLATSIPNLHVILAGTHSVEMKTRFNNQSLRHALDELKAMYQVVLVDSPPALGVSDASVISHEVDKTVLVVQHRRYPREVSLRAKRSIEEVQGNLVGVVLNAVSLSSDEGYYYYGAYADYYNKPQRPQKGGKRADKATLPTRPGDASSGGNGHPAANGGLSGQSDDF